LSIRVSHVVVVAILWTALGSSWFPAMAAGTDGPMATTRRVLERSHDIVVGEGDRKQKLLGLNDLLRTFLDTEALSRDAIGPHLDGQTPADSQAFFDLFRELFVRTYVQRLLLFEVPKFAYGEENLTGATAKVGTEIVAAHDRFAVDYRLRQTPDGWRATDILVEGISIAGNFRAQFDTMLSRNSFQEMLAVLRKKLEARTSEAGS
jgi:phospholipid transport system substrate-binding protein